MQTHGSIALRWLAAVAVAAIVSGCSEGSPWRVKDISGLMPELEFQLQATTGGTATAADFRGKITMLYFGYTHCPDVCPTTLGKLRQVIGRLEEADRVRVLFVTVDPARDTLDRLDTYLGYFGPQFIGLRGEDDALARLAKRYRVTYEREPADEEGDYTVAHSNGVFIFDARGDPRLLATQQDGIDAIVHDVSRLLSQRST